MKLRGTRAWALPFLTTLLTALCIPSRSYATELPVLGISVCFCIPWGLCPCEKPDEPRNTGPGDSFNNRDRYGPGRRGDSEAEKEERRLREHEKRRDQERRQQAIRQEEERIRTANILRQQAWADYRVNQEKAADAHRVAQAILHSCYVLEGQYQERAALKPDFGQTPVPLPSLSAASQPATAQEIALARIQGLASAHSAHSAQSSWAEPVVSPSGLPFQTPRMSVDWQQLAAVTDQYLEAKERITHFANYGTERRALVDVSAVLIEVADEHFASGEAALGTANVSTARRLLDTAVDFGSAFVPPVSMALDVVQLGLGIDIFTGEPLSKWDMGLLVADLVAFGCNKAFTKTAAVLTKIAAKEGNAARLAKPWLGYIHKADEAALSLLPSELLHKNSVKVGEWSDEVLAYLTKDAKISPPRSKRVRQYEKIGGFEQAKLDLERLAGSLKITQKESSNPTKKVFVAVFPNGIRVTARNVSRHGDPTLEIAFPDSQNTIKVRYHEL
jgi:hypothetical protein